MYFREPATDQAPPRSSVQLEEARGSKVCPEIEDEDLGQGQRKFHASRASRLKKSSSSCSLSCNSLSSESVGGQSRAKAKALIQRRVRSLKKSKLKGERFHMQNLSPFCNAFLLSKYDLLSLISPGQGTVDDRVKKSRSGKLSSRLSEEEVSLLRKRSAQAIKGQEGLTWAVCWYWSLMLRIEELFRMRALQARGKKSIDADRAFRDSAFAEDTRSYYSGTLQFGGSLSCSSS